MSVSAHRPVSRRALLGMLGGAGATVGLAGLSGCGRDPVTAPGSTGASGSSGSVTVAIPQAVQTDEAFYTAFFETFTADTGIEVIPRFYPDGQYADALQLLFQGGDEPDVFRMIKQPGQMPNAYTAGWLRPLDEFEAITEVLATYPDTARDPSVSGLHMVGELYGVPGPMHKPLSVVAPLLVNRRMLNNAGIDAVPETHSEVRAAARAMTSSDSFGFAVVAGAAADNITWTPFQNTAGVPMGAAGFNYQTGRASSSDESWLSAVDFLQGLNGDGVMAPGWQTMDATAFWQAFAAEQIGMAVVAPWWIGEIRKLNPDLELAFGTQPVPDSGRAGYTIAQFNPGRWAPQWGITKASQNAEAASRLIATLASIDTQRAYYEQTAVVPALAEELLDELSEDNQTLVPLSREIMRDGPNPRIRDDASYPVLNAILKGAPQPTPVTSVFSAVDEGADYASAAATYDAAFDEAMDAALAAPEAVDAGITRETFTFADWDPMQDYVTQPAS